LAKAKGKGNQVQNPGRSGHCKWEAAYQKATGEIPGKAVSSVDPWVRKPARAYIGADASSHWEGSTRAGFNHLR